MSWVSSQGHGGPKTVVLPGPWCSRGRGAPGAVVLPGPWCSQVTGAFAFIQHAIPMTLDL